MILITSYHFSNNPFEDDDDDEHEDFSSVVGVPVEALYDYEAQENDELSFKRGQWKFFYVFTHSPQLVLGTTMKLHAPQR